MAHTPTTPARDDRPYKILERTPVDDDHKARLFRLVEAAQAQAETAADELQGEFGRDAVALITGCNQFIRLYRGGEAPGRVELLVPDETKAELEAAGFDLHEPFGAVFKLFGWVGIDPTQGDLDVLEAALSAAYQKARA